MTKTKEVTEEQEIPKAEIRDVKSRRSIKLLFPECPLCGLALTEFSTMTKNEGKQYFQLVQFGTNPDGTGYESYHCQYCNRFFMLIISEEPIKAEYDFKTGNEQPQGQQNIFEAIFGGMGGNGKSRGKRR